MIVVFFGSFNTADCAVQFDLPTRDSDTQKNQLSMYDNNTHF